MAFSGAAVPVRTREARALALSFSVSSAIQGMNVVTGTILARHLGPGGRGELAAIVLWPTVLAVVGSLGIVEALTFFIARDAFPSEALVQTSLGLCLVQSLILIAIGASVAPLALEHYGSHAIHLTWLYLLFIPLNLSSMYGMAALNGLQRHAWYQSLRAVTIGTTVLGLLALSMRGRLTVEGAVIVYLVAWLATAAGGALALRAQLTSKRLGRAPVGQLLTFGVRSHSGYLSWMLNERLDQLVMSVVLAPRSLGLYVVAVTLASVTNLVGSSVAMVAFPLIARMDSGRKRSVATHHLVAVTTIGSILVTIPVFAALPAILRLFFGDVFLSSVTPGRVLLGAGILLSLNRLLNTILRAVGRPLDAGIGEFFALGTTVLGLALLLRPFGLLGAATTSLIAYLTSTTWMAHRTCRILALPFTAFLVPDFKGLALLLRVREGLGVRNGHVSRQ